MKGSNISLVYARCAAWFDDIEQSEEQAKVKFKFFPSIRQALKETEYFKEIESHVVGKIFVSVLCEVMSNDRQSYEPKAFKRTTYNEQDALQKRSNRQRDIHRFDSVVPVF